MPASRLACWCAPPPKWPRSRDANPFTDAPRNRTVAIFLDQPPPPDAAAKAVGRKDEEMRARRARDLCPLRRGAWVRSKLRIPAAKAGTARNLNTVAKLAAMAAEPASAYFPVFLSVGESRSSWSTGITSRSGRLAFSAGGEGLGVAGDDHAGLGRVHHPRGEGLHLGRASPPRPWRCSG